jgi:antitoxin (DNA-binding transcriptional repressor) of toxin-antitoxin stability system
MREAKEGLPGLVREAACGARLIITVHGKALADLVPHQEIPEEPPPPRPIPVRVKLSPGKSLDSVLDELQGDR